MTTVQISETAAILQTVDVLSDLFFVTDFRTYI